MFFRRQHTRAKDHFPNRAHPPSDKPLSVIHFWSWLWTFREEEPLTQTLRKSLWHGAGLGGRRLLCARRRPETGDASSRDYIHSRCGTRLGDRLSSRPRPFLLLLLLYFKSLELVVNSFEHFKGLQPFRGLLTVHSYGVRGIGLEE